MAEETARVEPCDRCGHGHRGVRIVPLDNPPCPECGNRMPNFDPAPEERDGLAERLEARAKRARPEGRVTVTPRNR